MPGVVSDPDTGFELGQEVVGSAAAGLSAFVDIVASIFQMYLLTTTMFLLVVSFLLVVIYFIGQWPSDYGTQLQYRRMKRSFAGLLLLSGIVPLLYTAGWIGSSSTTHGGLPENGMFGSGFERRIIGMNLGSDGLGMVVDIAAAFFRIYLTTVTSALLFIAVMLVSTRILTKLQSYGAQRTQQRTYRSLIGLLLASGILPLLYAAGWLGSGATSHTGLPKDGIFGTSIEQHIIGPTINSGGLQMFTSIGGAIFQMYLITLTTGFLALSVLYIAVHILARVGAYEADREHHRTLRSLAGLFLVTAAPPMLYASGWLAAGSVSHDGLPQSGLFGTSMEERIIGIGSSSSGIQMFVDIGVSIFRMYFATLTTLFIIIAVMVVAVRLLGIIRFYGSDGQYDFTWRSLTGLIGVTGVLPLLYAAVWIAEGSQSSTGYNLPPAGVFGTNIEDRIFGPSVGDGGFGEFASILASVVHTYQVSLSFVFIIILMFLGLIYAYLQVPSDLNSHNIRGHLQRAGLGLLASLAFIPVLHAIGWVATGVFRPEEPVSRVSPSASLSSEQLFQGPNYHPFIRNLSTSSDPLASVLRNILEFQVLTVFYVGVAAVVTGLLVYAVFSHSNYIRGNFGKQSFRGGVILIFITFTIPFVITGGAWVATGVPSDGYLGTGPPGFASQCTNFAGGMDSWNTLEGSHSETIDPAGLELDGTLSKQFEARGLGERSVTIRPITSNQTITVRIYVDGEQIFKNETTEEETYLLGIDKDLRVEVSSSGGVLKEVCAGYNPPSSQ